MNDLHFFEEKKCGPWFEKAVLAMKPSAPDAEFCLLCGDLADNGEAGQHDGVRTAFAGLGFPFTHHRQSRLPEHSDRRSYEEAFKDQINYIVEHRGWQLVGIDTTAGNAWRDTKISAETWPGSGELPRLDRASRQSFSPIFHWELMSLCGLSTLTTS